MTATGPRIILLAFLAFCLHARVMYGGEHVIEKYGCAVTVPDDWLVDMPAGGSPASATVTLLSAAPRDNSRLFALMVTEAWGPGGEITPQSPWLVRYTAAYRAEGGEILDSGAISVAGLDGVRLRAMAPVGGGRRAPAFIVCLAHAGRAFVLVASSDVSAPQDDRQLGAIITSFRLADERPAERTGKGNAGGAGMQDSSASEEHGGLFIGIGLVVFGVVAAVGVVIVWFILNALSKRRK